MLVYDFLLLGDYFFDLIYTGLPRLPVLGCEVYSQNLTTTGGAMFITAAALRRLGARVGWPGCFGSDYYSDYVRNLALQEGLDLTLAKSVDRPYRRVTTSLAYAGERAFITFTDPDDPDLNQHYLDSMDRCQFKHLHFGGLTRLDDSRPLLEKAHQLDATVSMDCQDVPLLQEAFTYQDLLRELDVFMPNAREALLLTGAHSVEEALRDLGQGCKLVVIKDGANGAWAIQDGQIAHDPAIPVEHVIDTTGAGDVFNAGFLFAHKVESAPLERCLRYGNICGGLSVTGIGGATAAPTYAQLQAYLGEG